MKWLLAATIVAVTTAGAAEPKADEPVTAANIDAVIKKQASAVAERIKLAERGRITAKLASPVAYNQQGKKAWYQFRSEDDKAAEIERILRGDVGLRLPSLWKPTAGVEEIGGLTGPGTYTILAKLERETALVECRFRASTPGVSQGALNRWEFVLKSKHVAKLDRGESLSRFNGVFRATTEGERDCLVDIDLTEKITAAIDSARKH